MTHDIQHGKTRPGNTVYHNKVVTIIGIGLIGGSLALALKTKGFASKIIGVESNEDHKRQALSLQLVDEILSLEEAIDKSDVIIIAVPVNAADGLIKQILEQVNKQVVIDVGSTKSSICNAALKSKNHKRFVATHPMWVRNLVALRLLLKVLLKISLLSSATNNIQIQMHLILLKICT